jgi:hypothetical protein
VVASIKVTKNGTVGAPHGSSTLTHNHTGHYLYAANAGDMDTAGEVEFSLNSGTNAMALVKYQVVTATVYDAITSLAMGAALGFASVAAGGAKLAQTVDLTAAQSIACSDKTGFSLSATGADLILKGSTFVQAIAAAINELATYGLTALNTLLVTTGIKAASVPNVTLANGAHGGASATITLQTAIAASGNWNVGKTGYSLTTAPPTAADIKTAMEAVGSHLALILADTGELQTEWANGGRLDLLLDAAALSGDPMSALLPGAYTTGMAGKVLYEINQSLNGAKVVIDNDAGTVKVYDTAGTTLLFTLTKTAVGNVYTITRT